MFKSLTMKEVYDAANLSFCFEFFTPLTKRETASRLSKSLGKDVRFFTDLDESFSPTYEAFKLAPTYDRGYREMTLSTGPLPYQEGLHIFLKTMNLIEAIGYTTDRCSVKVKIGLDDETLGLPAPMSKLNRFKYLIGLDESTLFEMWPQADLEKNRIYQNRLHLIHPKNIYQTVITENYIEKMDPREFRFPESEFFATDFSEIGEGRIVINYISGENYTKKKKEATKTINLVIEHLYETLSDNYRYSIKEKKAMSEMAEDFRRSIRGTRDYLSFRTTYPNIRMYVDLQPTEYLVESNYLRLREQIFALVVGSGISEAVINYDTARQKLQVKDAVISRGIVVESIEFYGCTVEADAKGCLFEGCTVRNSKLTECTIHSNNFIKNSKIMDCDFMGMENSISKSFIKTTGDKMINADVRECLVQGGIFTLNSSIDESTRIIAVKK